MPRPTDSPTSPLASSATDRPPHGHRASWRTAITHIEPNRILLRGFALDEVMGRVSFAEAIYLLLVGELPTPAIGRLMDAILVSLIDHGTTPPSTLAARNVATAGAPLRASVAAGILGFGSYHGGDIEGCVKMLEQGVELVRDGLCYEAAGTHWWRTTPRGARPCRGLGIASTRTIRVRPVCSRWPWNWRSTGRT